MPLTDIKIRQAKPRDKAYKLSDEKGLYLEISPAGGRWWRLKFRFDGKEKRLSLGVYPDVSLASARERRDEARKLLANCDLSIGCSLGTYPENWGCETKPNPGAPSEQS